MRASKLKITQNQSMKLQGKTAIVTGGASGIGRAIIEELYCKDMNIVFGDIDEEAGLELQKNLNKNNAKPRVLFLTCDVNEDKQLESLFKLAISNFTNEVNLVINNAGVANENKDWTDLQQINNIININLISAMKGTMLAVNYIKSGGCIINIGSLAGLIPNENIPIYSASKAGLLHYTRCMKYLNEYGIRVNAVAPSFVLTNMTKNSKKYKDVKFDRTSKSDLDSVGGFMDIQYVVDAALKLALNDEHFGDVLSVCPKFGFQLC